MHSVLGEAVKHFCEMYNLDLGMISSQVLFEKPYYGAVWVGNIEKKMAYVLTVFVDEYTQRRSMCVYKIYEWATWSVEDAKNELNN